MDSMIQRNLELIMGKYAKAVKEPFGKQHELWAIFESLQQALVTSEPIREYETLKTVWSMGQGNWARVPWVALLDPAETETVQEGVYCVFLFRQDMSGVYVTLNQGVTKPKKERGIPEARKYLRATAETIRKQVGSLEARGFDLDNGIDLHVDSGLGEDYEYSTIAYKLYQAGAVPNDFEILADLELLLQAYAGYIAPQETGKPPPVASPVTGDGIENIIEYISNRGFVFEPWHIAAYVTALRTKPFVILAGVSGTGKSKLPVLVAEATDGKALLIPVRPDWTDSSEVLGYVDLQGRFRPGQLLKFAQEAAAHPEKQFVCIVDEMNLARVEHYFAEVLSLIECRHPAPQGGFESDPLLGYKADLGEHDAEWRTQKLTPNLAIVGTVNMDESAHGFSRKVLDRAFTIELSDVDLTLLSLGAISNMHAAGWKAMNWFPRAIQLSGLGKLKEEEQEVVNKVVSKLVEINKFLTQAQLQVGYRTRDEVVLFVLHAQDSMSSFKTRSGDVVDPLDLAFHMKILPRITGGSSAVRQTLLNLLGWARDGQPLDDDDKARDAIDRWQKSGCPEYLSDAAYPRTAARLCLMYARLMSEGFTSFWL